MAELTRKQQIDKNKKVLAAIQLQLERGIPVDGLAAALRGTYTAEEVQTALIWLKSQQG